MRRGLMLAAGMALVVLFTASAGLAQRRCGMMGVGEHGGHGTGEGHSKAESEGCPMMGASCERWMGVPTFYLDRAEDLGLSEEQVASLRAIKLTYEKDAVMQQAGVRTAELEVADALSRGQVDMAVVEGRLKQAVESWTVWRLKRIQAEVQALGVLTPEQRAKAGASAEPVHPSPPKGGHEGHGGGGHMMRYGVLGGAAMATMIAVEHIILR